MVNHQIGYRLHWEIEKHPEKRQRENKTVIRSKDEFIFPLVESLNVLPKMKILMFPWVDEVNVCLVKLEELKRMPQLTKLGLKKWRTTNSDARILSKYILHY